MNEIFDYKSFLKLVPSKPGVYRMYDSSGTVIYVGKAKSLVNRLSSYFQKNLNSVKTAKLVSHIHHIEFTVVFSEADALILENSLIKKFKPHYNILLKDDKSYPYIILSKDKYPRVAKVRGKKSQNYEYFGPFPDSSSVKASLKLIQNIFPIRQCSDINFQSRKRPCLMYQIGKCLAPCVPGYVTDTEYAEQVNLLRLFLQGKDQTLLESIRNKMIACSDEQKYEEAAVLRDQMNALRTVQEQQVISGNSVDKIDIVGSSLIDNQGSIYVLFIRHGIINGTKSFFPQVQCKESVEELLLSFIQRYYFDKTAELLPDEIIIDKELDNIEFIQDALLKTSGKHVRVAYDVRSERLNFQKLATSNSLEALKLNLAEKSTQHQRIDDLEKLFHMEGKVRRMECYDISHMMGEFTVASAVVFGRECPIPSEYRIYNIKGIKGGDDFAAMHQVLTRRFTDVSDSSTLPDIVFVDGGSGQLTQAEEVIGKFIDDKKYGDWNPLVIGVAKGEGRKHGLETLIKAWSREEYHLPEESPAFLMIQHIRDESHRFAITRHRNRRSKGKITSILFNIPGIGAVKRKNLLDYFGGFSALKSASVDEIKKVKGINSSLAEKIYETIHS